MASPFVFRSRFSRNATVQAFRCTFPKQPLELFPYLAPIGQHLLDAVLILGMLSRKGSQQRFGSRRDSDQLAQRFHRVSASPQQADNLARLLFGVAATPQASDEVFRLDSLDKAH